MLVPPRNGKGSTTTLSLLDSRFNTSFSEGICATGDAKNCRRLSKIQLLSFRRSFSNLTNRFATSTPCKSSRKLDCSRSDPGLAARNHDDDALSNYSESPSLSCPESGTDNCSNRLPRPLKE